MRENDLARCPSDARDDLVAKVLARYGQQCVVCGFNAAAALEAAYVDRSKFYEAPLWKRSIAFLNHVLHDTHGAYEILCANCHVKRRKEIRESLGPKRRRIAYHG